MRAQIWAQSILSLIRERAEMSCLRGLSLSVSCVLLFLQSSHGSEIIGGNEVKPHSLPFMALIETPLCGGILVNPQWVLTAAHCDNGAKGNCSIKKVLLGVHNYRKQGDSTQVGKVVKCIPHPKYNSPKKTYVNDLMLLKLEKPVKRTKEVKCHFVGSKVKDPKAGSKCLVAGWGAIKNGVKKMSDVLRSVNVTVVDRAKCNSAKYYNRKPVITDSMICAGSDGENRTDTCLGDSGGPLLCDGSLTGVTSFGKDCGVITKPGVYTFLSKKHLSWIVKTVNKREIL